MTTQQNVGPAELRRIADALDEQSFVFSSAGWIVITNTTDVRQQAAAWEAERAKIDLYEGQHPAQLGPDGQEVAPRHRFTPSGVCIRCGSDVESDTGCVEELRAALEQARALAEKWAAMKYNGDLTAAVYHGCAEELAAALLAAASGGAA